MKSYLKNIGRIGTFLIVTMLAIMIGLLIITLNNKTSLHLTLNYGHNEVFDVFFKYLTHAGDGVFAILLVIITSAFFWKKYKWTYPIIGLCTIALSGITAQALKHFVFPDADR